MNATASPVVHLSGLLARAAGNWPDRCFLDIDGAAYSFLEIEQISNRVAGGLARQGVRQGDTVGVMLDNGIDFISMMFGVMKLGAVFVPYNTALKGDFLRHQVEDSAAGILVTQHEYLDRVAALGSGRVIFSRGATAPHASRAQVVPIETLWSDDDVAPDVLGEAADIAMLIYTSGTTGPSKGCMISHAYAAAYSRQLNHMAGLMRQDVLFVPMPLFHYNGIGSTLSALHLGSRIALARRYSVSAFWPEIKRTGATAVNLLGASIPLTAHCPDCPEIADCFGQIRIVLGAPFTPETSAIFRERFGIRHARNAAYGLTEACLPFAGPHETEPPVGSSGYRSADFDCRIVDADGKECAPGEVGELVIRPKLPNRMFSGYWRRPEETAEVVRDGWFYSGDYGKIDAEGYFFFVDRKKDYLRCRGENISSFEMEATFLRHPDIAQVAVHAIPSEFTEDEVKVTAVLKQDASLTEVELSKWSEDRVPRYALPRYIEFRESLPLTPSGRVQKFQLRSEGVTETTWDKERRS